MGEYANIIFLSLSLRIVNDPSPTCRVKVADVIISILRKVDAPTYNSLLEYSTTWLYSGKDGKFHSESKALIRTGAQVAGLLVEAHPDLFKKFGVMSDVVECVRNTLLVILREAEPAQDGEDLEPYIGESDSLTISMSPLTGGEAGGVEFWALGYHLLLFLEKFFKALSVSAENVITSCGISKKYPPIMEVAQEALLYPHSWVRTAACRFLNQYLDRRDPVELLSDKIKREQNSSVEVLTQKNGLYQMARRLSVALNQPTLPDALQISIVNCVVFTIRAMAHHPLLCEFSGIDNETQNAEDTEDIHLKRKMKKKENSHNNRPMEGFMGCNWIIRRLKTIGMDIRGKRRLYVLEIFIALVSVESSELITFCLPTILTIVLTIKGTLTAPNPRLLELLHEKAEELFRSVERKVDAAAFIEVVTTVQQQLLQRKTDKKREAAALAVTDPSTYSALKRRKTENKMKAKKKKNIAH